MPGRPCIRQSIKHDLRGVIHQKYILIKRKPLTIDGSKLINSKIYKNAASTITQMHKAPF
jgi:hypothetical protein